VVLAAPRLLDYHISIQRRVIRLVLEGPGPGGVSAGFDHVEGVLEVLRRPGSPVYAPGSGWRVQRVGDELYLRRGALPAVEVEVQAPGHTSVPERGLDLVAEVLPADRFPQVRPGLGGYRAAFDADRAAAPIRLRSWRPGDRIQPLGMAGRKKLSDLLVDARWPRLLRDEVLVLTCGEGIAWVAGVQSAHPFRVRDDTRRVLVMQLVRGGV
jgi:tRNA(Ile)-lysidine synthase